MRTMIDLNYNELKIDARRIWHHHKMDDANLYAIYYIQCYSGLVWLCVRFLWQNLAFIK